VVCYELSLIETVSAAFFALATLAQPIFESLHRPTMSPDTFIDPQLTTPDLLVLNNLLKDIENYRSPANGRISGTARKRVTKSNGAAGAGAKTSTGVNGELSM
jgi:hypothetical protein